ncbi:cation:proton antiporter [Vallitalea sp.]|jgi:Kef-type K+ transport system membrane component KefB|uniref:cation:proton antiporter n=1 Tax=Vallitalea sp. TaxID=1882829 RepID=UPI0025DB1132|nr:cation:proton antiporter [Vallitalea sp.]MCT4687049.1 cation:proton antiporter [Vallitalea sp.]
MDFSAMMQHAQEYHFLLQLAILLVAAAVGGWLASKASMPPVLGQILVGIIIGPTVFDLIDGNSELIHGISQIGVVFLMFLAGLETDLKELKASGKGASIIAMGGVLLPLGLGTLVPLLFFKNFLPDGDSHHQLMFALYIGTILTATSVSISVSVLRDMKQLASKQGISILGAAIIDDVVGIILLAVVSGMVNPSGDTDIKQLMIRIVSFFVIAVIGGIIISKGITKFAQGSVWRDRIVTFAIILCFIFAYLAEMFSVAAITGAYFAGVALATTPYRHRVVSKIQSFAYALFTPIFFVSIGLSAVIKSDIVNYIGYALVIVIIAIIGKMVGCGLGARLSGFKGRQSLQIGVGMIARAEVALIVANQGLRSNIITNKTFTSIVLLVVISTIVTPPLLKMLFKNEKPVEVSQCE